MNVNSVSLCVFVLSLLFECGHSNSPCPDIFNFYTDGKTEFGQITLEPVETVSFLRLRLNYTVLAELGKYLGRFDAPGDVLQKYNRGETVHYRVYFPVMSPLPKVTAIMFNDDIICTGPPGKPVANQILTLSSIAIFHSYGRGNPPPHTKFRDQPQPKPQTTPQPRPQTTPQPRPQLLVHYQRDYASTFAESIKTHAVGQTVPIEQFYPSFGDRDIDNSPFVAPPVTQRTETARPAPTTSTTTTTTPTTTRPVYSQPVKAARPEYHYTADCGVVAGISNEYSGLIKNGQSYERGEIPWLVAIYKASKQNLNFICGGTLVSDRHVVTAAHCVQGSRTPRLSEKELVVRVGVHDLNDWNDGIAMPLKVANATIYDFFNKSSLKNDLMILTLSKAVFFTDFIRPACLWNGNTELNAVVRAIGIVAGWGDVESDEPQKLPVPIVSTTECRASATELHKITSEKTLCAGDRNGSGPCKGDSGGGLYLVDGGKWRLRGVVSAALNSGYRVGECDLSQYVVYTDTAQYLPWIKSILSQKQFD